MNIISTAMAQAAAPATGSSSGISSLIFMAAFIAIFYFMLIRPQQKRAKEQQSMLAALTVGDEVVTTGGLLGRIVEAGDNYLGVEIAEGVRVKVQKSAITQVLPKGTLRNG
jgi:preprotein translocase subunit YajC